VFPSHDAQAASPDDWVRMPPGWRGCIPPLLHILEHWKSLDSGSVRTQRLMCRHLKLIDLFSLNINSDSVDINKKFSEFYTAYDVVVDQWNEFAGQQIPCTTFSSDDGHFYWSHCIIVLLNKKSLTTTFTQDSNSCLIFLLNLDVKTETLANLEVLVKTFLDDLWCELWYSCHSYWIHTDSLQISIGLPALTCPDYRGMMLFCIHWTTRQLAFY
jgi:hypothetical protein